MVLLSRSVSAYFLSDLYGCREYADRAREILSAVADPTFDGFATGIRPRLTSVLGMVEYSDIHNTYMTTG